MIAMAQLIACASNVEVKNIIRYLYIQNPTWLPGDIYHKICEVYGDCIVSVQTVRKWIRLFKERRTNVTNEDCEGRQSDARNIYTIAGVCTLPEDNCRLTVQQLELLMRDEMMDEVSHSTIWHIIRDDLNLRKVAAW